MKFAVKIDTALAVLEKNLQEHLVELEDAIKGWTYEVSGALMKTRAAVDRNGVKASGEELIRLLYNRPKDNRAEYSKYIGGMKLAKDSGALTIEMDESDYDRTFNDNWDWRIQSKASNAVYASSRRS